MNTLYSKKNNNIENINNNIFYMNTLYYKKYIYFSTIIIFCILILRIIEYF
jgi:hypothetical protein